MAKLSEKTAEDIGLSVLNTKTATPHRRIMLIGPTNEGKTTAALTAERDLDKMIVIMLESDALQGAISMGKHVDFIDVSNTPAKYLQRDIKAAIAQVRELMESGEKSTCLFSTLSTQNVLMQSVISTDLVGPMYWMALLKKQTDVFKELARLPGNLICECHVAPIVIYDGANDGGKARVKAETELKAKGLTEGDLKFDVAGGAYKFYKNVFSEIWAIRAKGKMPNREYKIYPYGTAGIESKTKHTCWSKEGEPADIAAMFEKMEVVSK